MAEIDVVMSVFNAGKYLDETLTSIQNQTIDDIRIIIIDDGSTDDTRAIISKAQENDPRILYQYQQNAGIVAAVNAGMLLCTAPLVARHDGDDISYPHRFEMERAYLLANEDCVAVSALARHIDEGGKPIGTTTRAKDMALVDDAALPANEPYILQPLLMMRRATFLAAGGYRLLTVAEDTDLYWRMMKFGKLHIMPEVLGDYRIHADSISSQSIVSGRRMSAWTQLSALSAQRTRSNLPDVEFTRELQTSIDSKNELIDLYRVVEPIMREDERPWFFSSMAAKLVETCYYRPFEPSPSDVDYILSVPQRDGDVGSRRFYDTYEEGILSAGIRMAIEGRIKDAFRLVPRRQWPRLVGRIVFRIAVSDAVKNRIKKLIRR
ncbi:glycosyltransferase [Lichenicola cladoniae]|uniref:Glycosyltransferase n=1 Tax=Lichenicola cladoniae TaxID=1484109 RepID=A0A6M8HNW6_9PROT|nr:glycosyltransferase [Lichenicola cladoniae]NPD68421.1 glycosyltransferase [Acetobacteraceae bacterium]QKE90094.1 glycosyltransferase [Lichenicola cladoniae]